MPPMGRWGRAAIVHDFLYVVRGRAFDAGWLLKDMMTAEQRDVPEDVVKAGLAKKMPLGEIPEDGDVANAVVFFASDRARMLTGQTLFVNGGEYFR